MIRLISQKIGMKTSLLTNLVLFLIVSTGGWLLVEQQCKNLEKNLFTEGRLYSTIGATAVSRILEEGVDNGVFTISDIFDTDYQEIPGFSPSKYHTKYDSYFDKAVLDLQDVFLKNSNIIFAIAVDINGYCPSHNSIFQNGITGDIEKDKSGNRTKRIFEDIVGKTAAVNTDEGLRQIYFRDTGEKIWDISSPIFIRGRHWGAFRTGISLKTIDLAKKDLIIKFSLIILCILIISMVSVFLIVNYYINPLNKLKTSAFAIANGKLDDSLKINSGDEVGQVAESIDRLRASLKHSMKLLKKQI